MIEVRQFDAAAFGDPVLEVRIARSAPIYPPSLKWVVGGFAILCLCVAAGFAALGAYPVFGFAGLEIVALLVLLRLSLRRASTLESVRLAGDLTVVSRDGPNGPVEAARLQSYWLRIDEDAYGSARGLTLRSGVHRVAVGAGLGAQELRELSLALRDGLHRLKSVPSAAPGM